MFPRRTLGWWYWLTTVVLLAANFNGWRIALEFAICLTAIQIAHYTILERKTAAFSVQIRAAFLGLLLLGLWEPLRFLHGVQLVGTTAVVLFDYCLLARVLALMPWNRRVPFTMGLAVRILFSRPVPGSILDKVQPISCSEPRLKAQLQQA